MATPLPRYKCFFSFENKAFFIITTFVFLFVTAYANNGGRDRNKCNSFYSLLLGSSTALASSANPSCLGTSITLTATVTPAIATGTVEFFDGAVSIGISSISGGVATLGTSSLSAGSHSLTAVYSGDILYTTSTSPVLTQVINAIPVTPGSITGSASVCPSTTGNAYSIAAVPGATSYTWTAPSGWTLTSGTGTISVTYSTSGAAASGNIAVAAVNSCGSSAASQTINISPVNATDNTGYTDGTTKFSDGITAATITTPVRRGYIKFPLSSLSVIPVGATLTTLLKLTNNGSGTSGTINLINGLGTNDPTISSAATLFSAAASGTNYHSGVWGSGGQISLTLNAAANTDIFNGISSPGYIAMGLQKGPAGTAIANFWGYSAGANVPVLAVTYASLRTLAVTVNPPTPAAPGTISGSSSVCPNSIGNVYTISAVTNATSYTWTVPAGWTITSGQGTVSITASAGVTGGNITVRAVNSCGTSATGPAFAVTIGVLPTVGASPLSQETCSGMPIGTITASNPNSVAGTTYTWIRDNVFITGMGFAGSTSSTITGTPTNLLTTQQTTTFTIYAVSGIGCISASPATVTVAVNANPVANAGIDQSGCAAIPVTIGGSPTASGGTAGYTYLWSAGVSNATIANPTAAPGTYTVTVTDSKGCTSSDAVTISTSTGTKTWIGSGSTTGGGVDNNFNNAANWSPAGVPGACNDVVMNIDIYNIFNLLSGALIVTMNSSVTIKSLSIDIGGTVAISSASYFKLYTGSNTLNILNATSLNTHTSSFFAPAVGSYLSVGPGGVISYGGNLTTLQSNNCLNYPFYADVNTTGRMYLYGNATLAGIGNDPSNKPGRIIFNGTGTQTITNNSGTQPIYLGATETNIGETNSPTVVLSGSGTNGFRNIGDLNINNTSTLDIGSTQSMNRSAAGGTINMAAGTLLKLGRNNGGVGSSNFPSNFSSFSFNATSTVDYNAAGGQTVFATPLYGNLTLSNTGSKTITGNTTVQNNITIQNTAVLQAGTFATTLGGNWTNYGQSGFSEQTSTINFNGSGAQSINTIGGEFFYTLNKTGSGTTTMLSDVAVQGGGTSSFTLSNGIFDAGTFTFSSAASSFNISSGLLKLAKTGASLLPEFAVTPYNNTGGTIELYGAGDQVLRGARGYRNLTFSTSGNKTISSAITSVLGTILTQNSVTLDVSNNTMGGAGTNLTMSGTSLYKTGGTGTKPDAQGTYSLGTGTTIEFTNSAATTEDIRLTAPTYYNLVVSGANVANTSLGTGIKFQAGGNFTVKNGGLFKLGNSAGFSGGAATSVANTNNPAITLEDGSTVEYYGGPAGTNAQIITNVIPYYGLNFSGTSVKTAPAGIITVKGNLSNNNSGFVHSNGTVLLNGTTNQNYNSTGTNLAYYNLTTTNAVNLNINGDLSVENVLSLGAAGKLNLSTGNISLKSTASNTARVDQVNLANSITYGTGGFIVERFIPTGIAHGKSWQFLSTPAFGQTVNNTWQEGNAPLAVGTAGLGTTLSSEKAGAVARGYDFYTTAGPSIKFYNSTTNAWDGIDDGLTPTNSLQLANAKGYMVFVRGDRSVQTSSTAANTTTFRTKGKIYSPGVDAPASTTVAPNKLESIGNPYASSIDFTSVLTSSTGIDTKYYVWDPLLAGSLGYGGYQVLSSVTGWVPTPGGTPNYPAGVPYSKIQSGQAFFVYSTPGGTVNFSETNKITGSQLVYRQNSTTQFLRTYLYNQAGLLADGNTLALNSSFESGFDSEDAIKIPNASENFGIACNDKILSINARAELSVTDTLFYHCTDLRQQSYRLKLEPSGIDLPGATAFFTDRFNNSSTPVSLTDSTWIDFNVTSDPASALADRFFIVFNTLGPVPVKFVNISAIRTGEKSAVVSWKVENEINIDRYEVERSRDGRNFEKLGIAQVQTNNGNGGLYNYNDGEAFVTDNFYRIKSIGVDNHASYSNIAKVNAIDLQPGISVYPNPVHNTIVQLHFKNQPKGHYGLTIINKTGQVVYKGDLLLNDGNEMKIVPVKSLVSAGNYQLSIEAPGKKKYVLQIIVE